MESTLLLQINPSSGEPIYKQIIDQINRLIMSGFLKAGDELPSVRNVAQTLEVNPMTISKAYGILEALGVLERLRGKGMIVANNQTNKKSLSDRLEMIRPILTEASSQARQLDLPAKEILKLFSELLEAKNE